MDMSPAALFVGLVVSGAGYVLFSYGRKASRWPHLLTGIALFAVTFLAPTPLSSALISAGLGVVLWVAVQRLGW